MRRSISFVAVAIVACHAAPPRAPNLPGECVPDPRAAEGLSPVADRPLRGKVGKPFRAVLTYVVPARAGDAAIEDVELQVGGPLPRGLLLTCSTDGCRFGARTRGCLVLDGTPTEAATVTLRVEAVTSLRPSDGPVVAPRPVVTRYTLVVARP